MKAAYVAPTIVEYQDLKVLVLSNPGAGGCDLIFDRSATGQDSCGV